MENENKLLLLAQDISIAEDEANPIFMQIKMRVCDSQPNLNDEGVLPSFISSIVNNQEKYNAVPLYCDVKNLLAKNYRKLGHMYVNGKFFSTQIGSLVNFYSETDDDGITSLYATARVPKREAEICSCIYELFLSDSLSFSFEVRYNPEHTVIKDGVRYIAEHPDNCLTGVAIVSVPAFENSVALDLVAEKQTDVSEEDIVSCAEQEERGEEHMEKENMTAEINEEVTEAEVQEQSEEAVAEVVQEESEHTETAETIVAEDVKEEEKTEEDPEEENEEDMVSEVQESVSEVLEHTVDTRESVENYGGEPIHVIEYHERIIETMAEAKEVIDALETQIAELTEIKNKYDSIIAEKEAAALAEKKAKAKAFAEKQGLDTSEEAVASAVDALDYQAIAEMAMAQVEETEHKDDDKQVVTLASFVELEISDDKYGGLLTPIKK